MTTTHSRPGVGALLAGVLLAAGPTLTAVPASAQPSTTSAAAATAGGCSDERYAYRTAKDRSASEKAKRDAARGQYRSAQRRYERSPTPANRERRDTYLAEYEEAQGRYVAVKRAERDRLQALQDCIKGSS